MSLTEDFYKLLINLQDSHGEYVTTSKFTNGLNLKGYLVRPAQQLNEQKLWTELYILQEKYKDAT